MMQRQKSKPKSTLEVVGHGGASGRSTTVIGDVEWSATGRVGVSLAELAAVRDTGFAFGRACSRLHEMQGASFRSRRQEW